LLVGTVVWGIWGYIRMPKRKDPSIPAMVAAAVCPWPGMSADRIEQQVARRIEEAAVQNPHITKVESLSQTNAAIILVYPDERVADVGREFDDVKLRLDGIHDLPSGAGPIEFIKDFGDTAALMLTVASPKVDPAEITWRAKAVTEAVQASRASLGGRATAERAAVVVCFPVSLDPHIPRRLRDLFLDFARQQDSSRRIEPLDGPGFIGVDGDFGPSDDRIRSLVDRFYSEHLRPSERHPDMWQYAVIHDPADTAKQLTAVSADKYSYRQLNDFTDLIQRTLQTVPLVSRVTRSGVLKENIFLEYSQQRLASFGLQPSLLGQILSARNIAFPGGLLESRGKTVSVDPTGEFRNEREIGDVIVGASASGSPIYLRDSVDIIRGYEAPRYLNFYGFRDQAGDWQRTRAITLGVQMRAGEQIAEFGADVDQTLGELSRRLPPDLLLQRVSDQPLQVRENINLFMKSLYEAIVLVVVVALIGFWEWRSAALMALAIPLTLAMTFGMMYVLGIDVQQVSIASLIIALGLLVDDPVVAGDAIRRDLAAGLPRMVAAWLGPTRLATAIVFATITNIVAYLPLLLVSGDSGRFIYSLPIVLTCSLVASRLVSMTFVPLLGYYLLRPPSKPEPPIEERRQHGFGGFYYRLGDWMLRRRWLVLAGSLVLFAGGYFAVSGLRTQFFPKDLSYLFYIDVWLPEDSTFATTDDAAVRAEEAVRRAAADFGKQHPGPDGKPRTVLASVDTFVGGGGPRFWFSATPELQQLNYAQLIIRLNDKHDTQELVAPLQTALSASVPGARIDVRQLETGKPIGVPVAIRISGPEKNTLRGLAEKAKAILGSIPEAARTRDDWGPDTFSVKLQVDADRANLAGVSNLDVALSSAAGISGFPVSTLRDGSNQIPIVTRLRMQESASLSDVKNLYVYSLQSAQRVPLGEVASMTYQADTPKIRRRNQFRTITVGAYALPPALPSDVMDKARQRLNSFGANLPSGYTWAIGGEEEEQVIGFLDLSVAMMVSVIAIFLALAVQFRSAVKPLLVFAAIPYGVIGALVALSIMGAPFGFMAFLGIASLIGVIVSHVIVLFDFIEEAHHRGEPLREALLDAGIMRLRPVLITVGATIFGLVPLAMHGGPLWEPLCYTQIGGLFVATFITLLLVPVLYSIFVLDLKIVKWEAKS